MTDRLQPAERLSEVLRLATLLADQVLDAQIMSRTIPDNQIRALLDATLLLKEYDVPLPPLLKQIMHEVGGAGSAEPEGSPQAQSERTEEPAGRLSRVMRAIRGARG